MKRLERILVATDLSENSRNGLLYACSLATENNATLTLVHVADDLGAWELYSDEFTFLNPGTRPWPADRVLSEAALDLNRFLEPHLELMKQISCVTKRVLLGPVPSRIAQIAEEEKADLIVMSPRRRRKLGRILTGSITDRVTRMSPCPVLSVMPPLPSRTWRGKFLPVLFGSQWQNMAQV